MSEQQSKPEKSARNRHDIPWREVLVQMDQNGKKGWSEDGYGVLPEEEKIAVSFSKLAGQVNNGGFHQFFSNGYGFYLPDLKKFSRQLDMEGLADLLEEVEDRLDEVCVQAENTSPKQPYHQAQLDDLDERFYEKWSDRVEERLNHFFRDRSQ